VLKHYNQRLIQDEYTILDSIIITPNTGMIAGKCQQVTAPLTCAGILVKIQLCEWFVKANKNELLLHKSVRLYQSKADKKTSTWKQI
jgi:hypothetical protein